MLHRTHLDGCCTRGPLDSRNAIIACSRIDLQRRTHLCHEAYKLPMQLLAAGRICRVPMAGLGALTRLGELESDGVGAIRRLAQKVLCTFDDLKNLLLGLVRWLAVGNCNQLQRIANRLGTRASLMNAIEAARACHCCVGQATANSRVDSERMRPTQVGQRLVAATAYERHERADRVNKSVTKHCQSRNQCR